MTKLGVLTERAERYVDHVGQQLQARSPRQIADHIRGIVSAHESWRARCLNMNPAEGLMSDWCKEALATDFATRLTEGAPGDKIYPHGAQNRYIDEVEAIIIALLRRQYGARFVEWRPISVNMANAAVFFSHLRRSDIVLSQAQEGGGNYSYHSNGIAGLTGAQIHPIPTSGNAFEIDLDLARALTRRLRPKMIVIGGSSVLFPYPVRELREIADECEAILVYDAAHVGLLCWAGAFQRPLEEGAHVMTCSTVKVTGGPIGGIVLTNDADIAHRVGAVVFPALLQKRDQNKYCALALSLAEMEQFGPTLARQMVANAVALGAALQSSGIAVIGAERGFTRTHQLFLELGEGARRFEEACQAANILLSDCALSGAGPWGARAGIRLGTHELTRLGMREPQMPAVAALMVRAFSGKHPERLRKEVLELRERFSSAMLAFDDTRST